MLIECPSCRAKVSGRVVGELEVKPQYPEKLAALADLVADPGKTAWPARVTLLECEMCKEAIVVRQLRDLSGNGWMEPYRLWPDPERSALEFWVPREVDVSLKEARKCLSCGAYTASVAMTGRALEGIARHFHRGPDASHLSLGQGLNDLHTTKVIDDRLFQWGKELHEHRNLAAHSSGATFTRREAQDLLDFALAICDYVFVLRAKYDAFVKRKQTKKQSPPALSLRRKPAKP